MPLMSRLTGLSKLALAAARFAHALNSTVVSNTA